MMASKKGSSFYSAPLVKRKFNFSEAEESTVREIDSIRVFLRVKPYDKKQIDESNNVFEVADSNTLLVKGSTTSRNFRNEEHRYTFTHIFASDVSQQEVFEKSVKESVIDLINGFSALIFTYGTTNAGKTFTVQGTTEKPGLIPRTLYMLFNAIEGKQTDTIEYMPCGRLVKRISEQELKNQTELRQTVLIGGYADDLQGSSKAVHKDSGFDFKTLDLILERETDAFIPLKPDSTYSLWISFYEIYNECIYDLLTPPLTANSQRRQLKIGEDAAKNSFVKELNYVNVSSVQDALKVLFYGRNNSQVAMTGLNAKSSRSHCIFTLTLVCSPKAAESGEEIVISQLSLCDLAGTERQKKTLNVGDRLKESQHINCSLHVLSRCFDIIRENQNKADRSVIPYRESKLTKLFQKALRGEEKIIMLVNINLAFSLDDTHQVLKTSAIARKTSTVIRPAQQTKRRSRSLMFRRSLADHSRNKPLRNLYSSPASLARGTLTEEDDEEEDDDDQNDVSDVHGHSQQIVESLLSTIDTQKKKLASYKRHVQELEETNATLEDDLRAELGVEYGKLIKTIEDRWKQRFNDKMKVIDERDQVIAELKRRVDSQVVCENGGSSRKKRKAFDCSLSMIEAVDNVVENDVDVIREENNVLKNDVNSLKSTLTYYKNENSELNKKYAEIKLLRRIENIATLREAVDSENMQRVLEEMDRMKEKFEAELSKRSSLIKEALDEMVHLEATYNDVLTENGKLEGDLLLAREELDDMRRALAISNEITAKKTEENNEMEIKLEMLESENGKLNDYIELAEAEIKCLKQKLMSVVKNRTQSADIFDDSVQLNDEREGVFREKYQLTNANSLGVTGEIDEHSQNTLCRKLENVSLELGSIGEGKVGEESQPQHSISVDSLNLSTTKQPEQQSLQTSISNINVSDSLNLSTTKQPGQQSLQPSVSIANVSHPLVNSNLKSLGETVVNETKTIEGNQTSGAVEVANDSLSILSQIDSEVEPLNVEMNQELEIELKQKIVEMTSEIEKIELHNQSLILLVDQYKEEKLLLENKILSLSEEKAKVEDDRNQMMSQMANEISEINRSNLSLKTLIEQSETEKIHLQEEIQRLTGESVESKFHYHEKMSKLALEINQIKTIHSTTAKLVKDFEKEIEFFQGTIEKLAVINVKQEEENKQLKETILAKDLEVQKLLTQRESALEINGELQNKLTNAEKFGSEMDEMASSLKMRNEELVICNREYSEKINHLIEELGSKNDASESQSQKLNDLEAERARLMSEIDTRESRNREYAEENKQLLEVRENLSSKLNTLQENHQVLLKELDGTKSSNREFAEKNKELVGELEQTNEKYESLSQKLNILEADHERLTNLVATKETRIRQIENELASKSKSRSVCSDEMEDVFFSPLRRENNENLAPSGNKAERPLKLSRNKTCDPNQLKTLSAKPPAKRITRSTISTRAQSTKSVSSPPHAQILKNTEQSCDSPAATGYSRRLLAVPNMAPESLLEEFPDDPEVNNESPVSTLNRLTATPSTQHRKLRNRRKK